MRNKALSPFIASALIILMGIVAITLVLTIVNPALDKAKDSGIVNEALQNLQLIDNTIREVASEGEGSKRTISLKVTEGVYKIDPNNDYLNFSYKIKTAVGLGISGQRDDINITESGNDLDLFISYTNLNLQGSDHFTKGDNSVIIIHNGTDSITNYPLIYVGK